MAKRKRANKCSTDPGNRSSRRGAKYYFDPVEAASVVNFIEKKCHHWQGEWAGRPFILEPWEREIVEDIFGWKRKDGTRRYRTVSLWLPKGNGKTMILGALAIVFLIWDAEAGAEVYSAAGDRSQAGLIFRDAAGIVAQDDDLTKRLKVFVGSKRITDDRLMGFYHVLSADADTKHGYKPSAILFDELHVQKKRDLFDTLKAGLMKRREPMLISISTAGVADEDALCYTEYEYAKACIQGTPDGIDDPSHYAVIYEADPDCDPGDVKVWAQCNPNIGISVKLEGLVDLYRKAKTNPAELDSFKRLHLNIWAQTIRGGIDMRDWGKCKGLIETRHKEECFLALDLSSKLDLTALVALFPRTGSVMAWFWIPEDNLLERRRREIFDYPTMVAKGFITSTGGSWVDQTAIRNQINRLGDLFTVKQVALDPWNAAQMPTWLQDEDGFEVVELRQGVRTMSEACKHTVGLIRNGKLRHGNNPVLNWNARNLVFRRDANDNWAPRKSKTGRKRIDGMVALIMAVRQAYVVSEDEAEGTVGCWGAGMETTSDA